MAKGTQVLYGHVVQPSGGTPENYHCGFSSATGKIMTLECNGHN